MPVGDSQAAGVAFYLLGPDDLAGLAIQSIDTILTAGEDDREHQGDREQALRRMRAGGAILVSREYLVAPGIGVGAIFAAVTPLILSRAAIDAANAAYPWTVGTLNSRPAGAVVVLALGLALLTPVALWLSRSLSLMRFSDAVALGLGTPLRRRRLQVLVVSVALTALAVSVAGPVGMVGLLGPEIARHLCGNRQVPLIGAALAGALVMVLADLAGRLMLAPLELPVGIVTAVVGGPWLLWILIRR